MSRLFFFCIPAWGHTNPTIPVVEELVKRGHQVRYYSFSPFREKIEHAGAEFICCDAYLPSLNEREKNKMKKVSTTQMTITDIETTARMDAVLSADVERLKPDCIVADSVCFWGKLIAKKYSLPFVCSTTTFAFNRYSSGYMQNSMGELADMILGMPRVTRSLKKLEPLGYHVKNAMEIIQNDNETNTIVYTSKLFQPCSNTFSDRYVFVGPSVKDPDSELEHGAVTDMAGKTERGTEAAAVRRKQIYISMGTVVNDRMKFYRSCISALKDMDVHVIMSVGDSVDMGQFEDLPDNISVFPRVNQMQVLSETDVFLTHCGMNSMSESLYMGVPVIMYPQTGEQKAVAKRTFEMGAGIYLKNDSREEINRAVQQIMEDEKYRKNARKMKADFRSCPGAGGAADFIEKIVLSFT